jgi:hypothetical protein
MVLFASNLPSRRGRGGITMIGKMVIMITIIWSLD